MEFSEYLLCRGTGNLCMETHVIEKTVRGLNDKFLELEFKLIDIHFKTKSCTNIRNSCAYFIK